MTEEREGLLVANLFICKFELDMDYQLRFYLEENTNK